MANREYDEGSLCQCFCDARGDPRGIFCKWQDAQVLSISLSYSSRRLYKIKFVSGINSNDRLYSATDLRPMPADDAAPPRKRARTEGPDAFPVLAAVAVELAPADEEADLIYKPRTAAENLTIHEAWLAPAGAGGYSAR